MRFPRAGIKQLRVPLAVAMGLSAVLAAPSGASATPSASPTVETVITMDVATGQVLSIKKVEAPVSPDISNDNICQSSDVCWKSGQTPYADQGSSELLERSQKLAVSLLVQDGQLHRVRNVDLRRRKSQHRQAGARHNSRSEWTGYRDVRDDLLELGRH